MPDIRRLYELQGVDLALDERNVRLAEIKIVLGDESSLVPLRNESRIAKSLEPGGMSIPAFLAWSGGSPIATTSRVGGPSAK